MENRIANIISILKDLNWEISTMESCTSGLLASCLTDVEGSSAVFKGSKVTYSNREKIEAGVDPDIIDAFGVYSKECAKEMAKALFNREYVLNVGIGVTGSLGNYDPANKDSKPGEVHFCITVYKDANRKGHQYTFEVEYYVHTIEVDCSIYKTRHEQKMYVCECILERLESTLINYQFLKVKSYE